MTPEELAAFEKWRQGKNIQSGVEYLIATAAWQGARAESAKEIAELQEQLSNRVSQTAAIALDMRREQAKNREAVREIADLKAQLDCNIDICKQVQEERDRLKAQVEVMRKDAERYQRLGWLVEAGDWGVFFSRTIDSHGNTEDTYMDDKSHMDICLDAPETIEDAEIIRRVTESRAAIEQEKQNDH